MVVIANQGPVNLELLQQFPGMTGILGSNQIHVLEGLDSPQGHVL